ncbi:centrosomal protein of 19 kDa-like [Gigantopelta aegis]|uniref:centrosomal protein of 19 kDa-like n=1 Tax=Gigantopelta aegis TaxID=1735272 RepID=UPI001B8884FE|nr:centrosomal protein of 19 kDa-like [Gigantopelta aegis]XP_041356470.1 centrosomal protein of 19 kDa-like [Gigantopelta aegis]
MSTIELKKCGVKFDPPALVLMYMDRKANKLRLRTMPLRNFDKSSKLENVIEGLKSKQAKYVAHIQPAQLLRLLTIIKDKLNGMSLEASLARNDALDQIDPDEDLNKLDEETLWRKKLLMDKEFEKNRKKPGDPEFQYEVTEEFETEGPGIESAGWDSDGSDPEF